MSPSLIARAPTRCVGFAAVPPADRTTDSQRLARTVGEGVGAAVDMTTGQSLPVVTVSAWAARKVSASAAVNTPSVVPTARVAEEPRALA